MSTFTADFLIKNAAQLATPIANSGFQAADFMMLEDGAVAAFQGEIGAVGKTSDVVNNVSLTDKAEVIDATHKTITPGLVDCHTHPVFYKTREQEFEMRILGKSYEEIALAGGGIRSSVRSLRAASHDKLLDLTLQRLDTFLSYGTTTIEAKSGYGLSLKDEIKTLEVISDANRQHAIDIVPTFLGAHETPDEFRGKKDDYLKLVVNEMLPEVKKRDLAEYCDIFCENHVFSVEEARTVLEAALDLGFRLKIHSEQLQRIGGTKMAAELGATSADHLDYTIADDWEIMLQNNVVPVVLPGAVFFLAKNKYADARSMLDLGLPVALATDFNPGSCMTESLPLMMTLACLQMKLIPQEALTACTLHGALALNRGNLFGSIEVGKKADLAVWDVPNVKHLSYHFGINLIKTVVKSGKIVYQK